MRKLAMVFGFSLLAGLMILTGQVAGASHKAPSQLIHWVKANKSAITQIAKDIGTATSDANNQSNPNYLTVARADAVTIQLAAESDLELPPIPNPRDEGHWAAALAYFDCAAESAITGIDQSNVGVLEQGNTEYDQGRTQLLALVKALLS
jgi:hypothetical protein